MKSGVLAGNRVPAVGVPAELLEHRIAALQVRVAARAQMLREIAAADEASLPIITLSNGIATARVLYDCRNARSSTFANSVTFIRRIWSSVYCDTASTVRLRSSNM